MALRLYVQLAAKAESEGEPMTTPAWALTEAEIEQAVNGHFESSAAHRAIARAQAAKIAGWLREESGYPYKPATPALKIAADAIEAGLAASATGGAMSDERMYPCADCGKLRTKAEGGTVFTVCDECWDKHWAKVKSMRKGGTR